MSNNAVFEVGLVMAGAVSAGAYSAGVMDFLIEALDAYEDAKRQPNWSGPTHDVKDPRPGRGLGRRHDGRAVRAAFLPRYRARLAGPGGAAAWEQSVILHVGERMLHRAPVGHQGS